MFCNYLFELQLCRMRQGKDKNMQKYSLEFFFSAKSLKMLRKAEFSIMYGVDPARFLT